jgi:hypothetical protein
MSVRAARSLLLLALLPATARAQGFVLDLGATGADGPLVISGNMTVPLPASGVFQATTVNIAAGATLKFSANAHNTGVTIVSQGDIVINGTIDISGGVGMVPSGGTAGPGGWPGGIGSRINEPAVYPRCPSFNSGMNYFQAGYDLTPFGACGGNGSAPQAGVCPTAGGGGGGGGGSIVLISDTAIKSSQAGATIDARGGLASTTLSCAGNGGIISNPGQDGTVVLVAPTFDAATLTLRGTVYLERLVFTADPVVPGPVSIGNQMVPFVSPPTVSIVSVNGVAPPAGETAAYNFGAATSAVIILATGGCTGGNLAVHFSIPGVLSSGSCQASPMATYNPAPATTQTTFTCALSSSFTSYIDAWADCVLR